MDIRQSKQYANFMKSLGWKIEKIGKWQAFIKPFPIIGSFIKIQRIGNPIPWEAIKQLSLKHRAYRVIIEPNTVVVDLGRRVSEAQHRPEADLHQRRTGLWPEPLAEAAPLQEYKISNSTYSPTKTIHIDLTPSEETIFNRFNPTTRRAVRRAMKNNVVVTESDDIESFIKLKTKRLFPLGFLMGREIRKLWNAFQPKDATLLLAYQTVVPVSNRLEEKPHSMRHYNHNVLGGILLLFHNNTVYYWHAASSDEGKKLFAPTLLVWEALILAKKRGCNVFDFEGIYDERYPKDTKNWRGFTRFKSGFGGREITFLQGYSLVNLPFL